MSSLRDAILAKRSGEAGFEGNRDISKAELIKVDGSVKVGDRPGFVWAREYGQHGGVFQVFNPVTTAQAGLPVLVAADPKYPSRRRVLDVDWETIGQSSSYNGDPYLPGHHLSHERYDGHYGSDPINVYLRMLYPLRCMAGTGLTVSVAPLVYQVSGGRVYYQGVSSLDLSAYVPAISGKARLVLVYLDTDDNTVKASGGELGNAATGSALSYPAIPGGGMPAAYVRLAYGETEVSELDDIEDARLLFTTASAAAAGMTMGTTIPTCGA